jgi:putative tryptophan/tyrosine transport system substrate-binding protein
MPLKMRPIGLGSGAYKDNVDYNVFSGEWLIGRIYHGWVESRNVKFDIRWTGGDPSRMRRYAAELVGLAPEVIMNGGLPTLVAIQQETHTIPVVFAQVLDPVGAGFVESLAHPGGNITGFVSFEYSMAGKWLETLKLMAPQLIRIGAVRDLASPSEMGMLGAIQALIPALGMELVRSPQSWRESALSW